MSNQDEFRRRLQYHRRRLQKLEEIRAIKGIDTAPETLIEIEDLRKEIVDLESNIQKATTNGDEFVISNDSQEYINQFLDDAVQSVKGHERKILPSKRNFLRRSGIGLVVFSILISITILVLHSQLSGLISESTSSLLDKIPDNSRSELFDALGSLETSYPRNGYSFQEFEGGVMFWWNAPDKIYGPLYVIERGFYATRGADWALFNNTWAPDQSVIPDDCTELDDIFGPSRGFGNLWCHNTIVNEKLGKPKSQELTGNNAFVENYTNGIVFSVPAKSQVWVLLYRGDWQSFELQ